MDSKYNEQAEAFLKKTNTTLDVEYIGHGPFWDDENETRDIYRFTLTRDGRKYSSKFGQSIVNSGTATAEYEFTKEAKRMGEFLPKAKNLARKRQKPTAYNILACLTKYEPGTLEDFCSEFGYDVDSRKAEKTYFAVQKEYKGVCLIWNAEEREQLAEINQH